jgi:3-oxoacyl-[acyl-carrier-protein] synthase-3
MRARIVGTGHAVPEGRITNADLEKMVETSDEWITTRTGIEERRRASAEECTSTFAVPAVERALEMAGLQGEDVDLVVCGTVTPDMYFPATACTVQDAIGARSAAAFDMNAGCTGFVYALGIASQFIETGRYRNAVVVGAELLTKYIDWSDRGTCILFGDGAGAVVLKAEEDGDRGVLGMALHSDGALGNLIFMPGGGTKHPPSKELYDSRLPFIKMRGNETFKIAVRSLAEVSDEVLERCGLEHGDVDWFIPHQANRRIIDAVGQRLRIPEGRTYVNIERFGNTSAASIPIALDELNRAGELEEDHVVLLSAFGAGLTWGAAAVRW